MIESPGPLTHKLITVQHSEEQKKNVTKGAESLERKKNGLNKLSKKQHALTK